MISMEDRVWLMNAICEVNHPLLAAKFVANKENTNKLIALRQQVGSEKLNQVVDQLKKGLGV